jgi:hypothetical protein
MMKTLQEEASRTEQALRASRQKKDIGEQDDDEVRMQDSESDEGDKV